MTGSALRLEESRDGRWFGPGGKYLSTGGVQRGKVTGLLRDPGLGDSPKWPFRLRHPPKMEMLGGSLLKHFMLKMTISPETSSKKLGF